MSNEELVAAIQAGDTERMGALWEQVAGLCCWKAKQVMTALDLRGSSCGVELDDLMQTGYIALVNAVETYQPEKNIKLATYASRCIENEILMYLRKNAARRGEVSFDEPLNTDWDGNELLLSDILGTEADIVLQPIEADADCQMLLTALNTLTRREREIITLRYGLGGRREQTQKEVADRLGISQSYISRLEKRTLQRLRRELQRLG